MCIVTGALSCFALRHSGKYADIHGILEQSLCDKCLKRTNLFNPPKKTLGMLSEEPLELKNGALIELCTLGSREADASVMDAPVWRAGAFR